MTIAKPPAVAWPSGSAEWKQQLAEDMTAQARELLGTGFVPDYYETAASGFLMVAEAAIGEKDAELSAELAAARAEIERLTDRWTELRERAEKGRDTVTSMYRAAHEDETEYCRLAGKVDGIKTVLSYMDDAERAGR